MRKFVYPSWSADFENRVTTTGGAGMPAIVQHFDLFNRAGMLVAEGEEIAVQFARWVEEQEAVLVARQAEEGALKSLAYPRLTGRGWQDRLRNWMQAVYDVMGINVEAPPVPKLSRNQRRAFKKYGLIVLFIPAIHEGDYSGIKPDWGRYLTKSRIERIALPGRWVAIETIGKPDYTDKVYPNDQLMADIGVDSRFNHPHSGLGEGDDIVEDILPKMGKKLLVTTDQTIDLQTAEIFNFVGNIFNWLTKHTADTLPNLGSTLSWEWCKNSYDSRLRLFVGGRGSGGLADVSGYWRGSRNVDIGFRTLVVL